VFAPVRRPLIAFTPKSLLRHKAAVSQVAYLPRLRAWYQASVKSGSVETASSLISASQ